SRGVDRSRRARGYPWGRVERRGRLGIARSRRGLPLPAGDPRAGRPAGSPHHHSKNGVAEIGRAFGLATGAFMHFRQFYVGCLAHASYLIGDAGEAVVIDPSRDIEMYLEEAKAHGLRITWVLETHLHADFVSGHRDLAERTGAKIGIGADADAKFPHVPLKDGDEIAVGGVKLRAIATPGHTPESFS